MTKEQALDALEATIKEKWQDAKKAFDTSRASVTSDQSKQESKYDTRGLEESYLAHGLAQSVMDLEEALSHLNTCRMSARSETVQLGSLIHCRGTQGQSIYFLLSSSGGGIEAESEGNEVTIITPESPLAKNLTGKVSGESISTPSFTIKEIL